MKLKTGQISIILLTLLLSGCFDPPDLSEIPNIEFVRLQYYEIPDDYVPVNDTDRPRDSLVLTFSIEDGDGNVGLTANDNFPPYHSYNLIVDAEGELVRLGWDYELPFFTVDPFENVEIFSETDNRPTYNCKNYALIDGVGDNYDSALYIEQNPYHNNLHVSILKKINGEYVDINYADYTGFQDCALSSWSARIPLFEDSNLGKTLKGEISYSMPTDGHKFVLSRDTFKIRFQIYDRALNPSNVVETPDLTLPQILVD